MQPLLIFCSNSWRFFCLIPDGDLWRNVLWWSGLEWVVGRVLGWVVGLACAQVLEMTPPQKDYWANMQHKKITGIPSVHSDYKTLSTGGWEHCEWNRSTELVSSFSCADLTLLQAHHPLSSLTSGTVWALVLLPSFMFCKQNIKITITICIILIIW